MLTKTQLRQDLLKKRRALPLKQWQEKSDCLCRHLQTCPLYQQAKTILAYFSVHQEPDLRSLFNPSKIWGFPRCVENSLIWHQWQVNQPLNRGKYGILEPYEDYPLLTPNSVDLILVPAVACDRRGYRLGYGGGYYDRLFSHNDWKSIPTLGIIFDFAYLSKLPTDPWDCSLKGLCTEKQWQLFEKFSKKSCYF